MSAVIFLLSFIYYFNHLQYSYHLMLCLSLIYQVPFRLTRDIIDGMGVTGVEGVFRRCCEETLLVMRTNKEALLTIIEVKYLGSISHSNY